MRVQKVNVGYDPDRESSLALPPPLAEKGNRTHSFLWFQTGVGWGNSEGLDIQIRVVSNGIRMMQIMRDFVTKEASGWHSGGHDFLC
jgi:hypothetical protein